MHGDTAWSLIVGGSLSDVTRYLDDRAAKGFSAVIVNLVERCFAPDPPRTTDGLEPFADATDFATITTAYLERAASVIDLALERGLAVLLCPAYLGYREPSYPGYEGRPEGWYDLIVPQPVERLREYGRRIGRALAHLPNIIWVLAGDRMPGDALPHMEAMADGLRETYPAALFTAHLHPGRRAIETFPWLELNQTYSYGIVHRRVLDEYRLVRPPKPVVLFESSYEGDSDSSRLHVRRQSWWAMLSGACGQFFGNRPIWGAFSGWLEALDSDGALDQVHMARFFADRPWWLLEPDVEGRLLVGGMGEAHGLDRATAAIASDGSLATVYVPEDRDLVLDLRALPQGRYEARWHDPRSGDWHEAGRYLAASRWPFSPPGPGDWVLLLERIADDAQDGASALVSGEGAAS